MIDAAILAARDNADWCDAVSRAHGADSRFEAGFWINPGAAPPFYPNLVTLDPQGADDQRRAIEALLRERQGGLGVKDSFYTLDLTDLDLTPVIEAEWLHLGPEASLPAADETGVSAAGNAEDLALWERAWRGGENGETVFPASLLDDQRLAFLSVRRSGSIVAGAAVNLSDGAVGISNVFLGAEVDALPALLQAARRRGPGLPLVGYEHRDDRAPFHALGFASIGRLRIWIRD